MTYASILVPVDVDPSSDSRIALAVAIANRFEASLIGLGAEMWRAPFVGDAFNGGYVSAELIASEQAEVEANLKRAAAAFAAAAKSVGAGSEWRQALEFPLRALVAEVRAADLIVTNRPSASHDARTANPAALVLQAGRPVLIAPADSRELELGLVLVAWKDAREARRAVADALPLLKRANAVVVTEICPHEEETAASARLQQVCSYLARHGVRAQPKVSAEEKGVSPPDQLLELADHLRPGLIVAGAYGHTRFQEWIFGGFTNRLLTQTSRAVLFSH